MRRRLLMLLVLSPAVLGAGQPGGAPDRGYGRELPEGSANLDFIVVNRTGRTIVDIRITPSGEESPWSDDILIPSELPDRERGAASYTRDIELCRWDVQARFDAGTERVWRGQNLCEATRLELR